MLDKLEKFEEKANEIIEKLKALIFAFIHKLIPQKVFNIVALIKLKIINQCLIIKRRVSEKISLLVTKLVLYKNLISKTIDAIQKYPIKEKTDKVLEHLKKILLKTPLKNHANWFIDQSKYHINKFDETLERLGKSQLGFAAIVLFVMSIGFYGVYRSTSKIYQEEFTSRTPASVQQYAKNPKYKMYIKKTLTVENIKVPIFAENVKQVRSITISFSVRTSTRFAKQYLVYYENQLKDYFFTSVEPVISSFPLESEGKLVLKEKIIYELNNFLAENKVEGLVEEVSIVFISAN